MDSSQMKLEGEPGKSTSDAHLSGGLESGSRFIFDAPGVDEENQEYQPDSDIPIDPALESAEIPFLDKKRDFKTEPGGSEASMSKTMDFNVNLMSTPPDVPLEQEGGGLCWFSRTEVTTMYCYTSNQGDLRPFSGILSAITTVNTLPIEPTIRNIELYHFCKLFD